MKKLFALLAVTGLFVTINTLSAQDKKLLAGIIANVIGV